MCYGAIAFTEIILTFLVHSSFYNDQLPYSENVVDFTLPFMNLGIGIMYKKRILYDFKPEWVTVSINIFLQTFPTTTLPILSA